MQHFKVGGNLSKIGFGCREHNLDAALPPPFTTYDDVDAVDAVDDDTDDDDDDGDDEDLDATALHHTLYH